MKYKIVAIFLIFTFIISSGFGCKLPSSKEVQSTKPITIDYWGVYDDSDAFSEIIASYNALHPFVTINYTKMLPEEYEEKLIDAMAEDRGPDIFRVQSTWLPDYQSKLTPLPPTTKIAHMVKEGTLKKKVVPKVIESKSLTLKELKEKYVDTVYKDVVMAAKDKNGESLGQKIYGLPLAMDTMVMYYNKDLLNNAGIISPPEYWDKSFQEAVKKLTKQNNKGNIIQAGVAMGGSDNIERSEDILSLLMMQNGAIMMNEDKRVMFHKIPENLTHHPGVGALEFYSDFSNPGKEVYSWSSKMPNSLTAFSQGNLAIMFGYAYHLPIIRTRAPKLNFDIAKMPQIENNPIINHPNYWVEVVSAKSDHVDEAWDFIQFMNEPKQIKKYLEKTQKPTALRALVEEQKDDLDIGIFAEQVLTAENWYHGHDTERMQKAMNEMIDLSVAGQMDIENIIKQAANKVQQTVER